MNTIKKSAFFLFACVFALCGCCPEPQIGTSLDHVISSDVNDYIETSIKITPLSGLAVYSIREKTSPSLQIFTPQASGNLPIWRDFQSDRISYWHDDIWLSNIELPVGSVRQFLDTLNANRAFSRTSLPGNPALSVVVVQKRGYRNVWAQVFIDLADVESFAVTLTDSAIGTIALRWLLHWEMNI